MAEFILGRIKFVYQGTWTTGQNYVVDDVVTLGGKTYICIESHLASSLFATDYNETAELSKWSIVSDGQVWTGDWDTENYYNIGDLVKYGGLVYVCNTPHESSTYVSPTWLGLEDDQANWDVFATSFDWKGSWTPTSRYKKNDVINYGGVTYVANTNHISAPDEETVLNVTGGSYATNVATITFTTTSPAPFPVGSVITIEDVVPAGYNGIHTVTASSTTSVSFSSSVVGAWVSDGTITSVGRLEASAALWDTFNAGIDYKGLYDDSAVYYKLNDIVKYGADLWICTTPHSSTDPFTNANWDIFVNGFEFENSWSPSGSYQIGDIVTYGGYSYVCKQNHSTEQTPSTATAYWDAYTTGFKFAGDWTNNVSYLIGDVVRNHGYTYLALIDSPSIESEATDTTASTDLLLPNTITADTTGFVAGMTAIFDTTFGGITAGKTYYILSSGLTATEFKISLTPAGTPVTLTTTTEQTVGITVYAQTTNTTYWTRLNSGFQWTDNPQTYTAVTTTNVTVSNGAATGAEYTVARNGTTYTLTRTANGTNYTTGDIVKILGSDVGGLSPINDISVTLTASAGAITGQTYTGISSTWKSGVVYVLGDIAFFGANSYTCVQTHTSEIGNRPDADTLGTYWNVLSAGAEAATLTTAGDTIYYGPNGPSRLPIGTDGQVLRVTDGYPAWKSYGIIQNLVYVGPEGVDVPYPQAGFSIDRPWASVRYACQQVEKGYLNPQSQLLILKNKQFILKEVNNYIVYTYKVTTTGTAGGTSFTTTDTAGLSVNMPIRFTGTVGGVSVGTTYYVKTITANTSFTISLTPGGTIFSLSGTGANTGNFYYDTTKTERDSGIIVDSVIFDIGHGGTQKSTESALAYFDARGTSYITANTGYELTQFVGALTYLAELLDNVLNKTAPTYNYQTLNSVSEIAEQDVDVSLIVEDGVIAKAADLVGIVTGGLNGGTTSAIPAIITPDTTISIKTGTYNEILPVNVPAYTALLGDELRSTVIQPKAGNPLLATVVPKTIKGFNHIKGLIPSIISNTTIAPTTGNTTDQAYLYNSNENVSSASISSNANLMVDILANGLTAVPASYTLPTPTGGATNAYTAGYFNAARLIKANRALIVDEVQYLMNNTYSTLWNTTFTSTQRAQTLRDAGYIVDAVVFDLTYGGNLATVIAGRSYYSNSVSVVPTSKTETLACQARIKDIIDNIAQGLTTGWTKNSALSQNTSGIAGSSTAATFAQARVQEVYDATDTGTAPTTITPDITWPAAAKLTANTAILAAKAEIQRNVISWINTTFPSVTYNQTTCSRDVGYLIDAIRYDMMFGSNFLSSWNASSYYRALVSTNLVLAEQLEAQLGMIGFISASLKELTYGGTGSVGSTVAVTRLKTSYDIVYNAVASGLGAEPQIVRNSPTGWGSSLTNTAYATTTGSNLTGDTTGYNHAVTQISQNYNFIVAEVLAYLALNYSSIYSAEGIDGPSRGYRDITYVLDSMLYDLTYGGNTQSLIAGSSYYSFYALNILSTEEAPFLDAFGRLKTIITQIVQKTSVTKTTTGSQPNTLTQVTSGTAGSVAAGGFAQDRVQEVIDWITDGEGASTIAPYYGWADASLQTAYTSLTDKLTNIQSDTTVWCQKYYQSIVFDLTLTSRDAGLVTTAAAYDMVLGTNFNAIQAGRAFCRATTSATTLRTTDEIKPTLGAINFMYYKAKQIAASGAVAQIQTTIDDITDFLDGGVEPATITLPQPGLPEGTYTSLSGTVLSGGGNGSAAFTVTRTTNDNGYYNYVAVPTTAGASYTTSSKIKILGTSIGGATPSNDIILNVTEVSSGGVISVTVSDAQGAVSLVESNRKFIIEDIISYIEDTYTSLTYDKVKTRRDANYILDAVCFDLTYGGNWASQNAGMAYYSALYGGQIDTYVNTATLDAIDRISSNLQNVINNVSVSTSSSNPESQIYRTVSGGTVAATQANALVDIVYNFVNGGLTSGAPTITVTTIATTDTFTSNSHGMKNGDIVIPQATTNGLVSTIIASGTPYFVVNSAANTFKLAASYNGTALTTFTNGTGLSVVLQKISMPDMGWVDSTSTTAYSTVTGSMTTYQTDVVDFINTNYPALTYNDTYAKRDTFNVALAAMIDMTLNTNFGAIQAGRGYNRSQDYKVQGYEKAATIGSLNYLETLIATTLSSTVYTTQLAEIDKSIYLTINLLDNGSGETPEVNGTISYNHSLGMVKGAEILRANIPFLANEMTAYLTEAYSWEVISTDSGTDVLTTSDNHGFAIDDPVKFSGTTFGGVNSAITYYIASVPNSDEFTLKTALGTNANTGASLSTTVQLSTVASGSMTATYVYNEAAAQSDTTYFLEAIVYDLQYTGNYRSLRHAQVLLNSINGSQLSDMWYVRNACGVRNMTMTGLSGALTNVNAYGTKRPTAGAYTSLDPGFGPNDSNAWVNKRSTYMQNCSLFGSGCTGAKIDGAIHAGGNRSMVMNDYTTFLSDGIGIWCTGSNSLTELVSVFSYYGYSGYLAELGAKIRATNGNSSYGTYGVIAEGVDTYETPLYATLDNRANDAFITNVFTDGADEILRVEFANAGQNYSNASWTISGAGYNATAIGDEIRDYGVFETRLIDLDDGYGYGGDGYLTAANASQLSATGYITIAASDQQLSPAYVGMRVLVTAGTGAGQSAAILNYNNGSKVAKIYKESFTTLTVSATTAGGNNLLTVASTATLYVGMPIYLGTAIGGLLANTLYYVIAANLSATQFAVSTSSGGSAETTTLTSGQTVTLYAAGWDNVIPGKAVVDALDLTSNYIIEPRISYTGPGYTATGRTLASTATWQAVTYGAGKFVAIPTGSAATTYSANGTSWSGAGNLPTTTWTDVVYGGGEGATATAVVGGLGGIGAQLTATIGTGTQAGQVISVTVVKGGTGYLTKPTIEFVSGTGSSAVATAVILDGVIVGVTMDVNGSGYATAPTVNVRTDVVTEIIMTAWGKNYTSGPTVTITGGGASSQATTKAFGSNSLTDSILTNAGVSQILVNSGGAGYTSTPTVTIVDTVAKFVAIPPTASGGTTKSAYQTATGAAAASAWTASTGSLPNGSYASIAYGAGYWLAIGGTASAVRTLDGDTWASAGTIATTSGTWQGIAYGNGYFVAIPTGDSISAVSSNSGGTWSSGGTLPASTTWSSIAYGNGRFVALAATGRVAYSVNNGTNWTNAPSATGATTSVLSSSYTWKKVAYGQGLFYAIGTGSICATSPDGINWTTRNMSSSSSWIGIAFGNPNNTPIWAAVSATSGQVGSSIRTGATAQSRAKVVQSTISEIRMIDPGSGYPHGEVTTTTTSTNVIATSDTTNLSNLQPIEFTGCDAGGLVTGQTYYVIGSTIVTNTSFKVADSAANAALGTAINLYTATGLSGTYKAGPILTQVDPNKSRTAATRVRLDVGALGNPSFSNRGTANTSATANVVGDGFSDLYQTSSFINVRGLYSIPKAGANVEFASLPGEYYKLVSVTNQLGLAGEYTATFQVNPAMSALAAPLDGDLITTRLKYSQVRLTGHDFLYIGVGNFTSTNYPNVNISTAITASQTLATNGGRTFFTSTDQDGNFNVGNLFGVQQSTGTATLNASAFNLSGLQSLQLGTVAVGAGSAVITSFSTDPYFTANSDNILPTQKAIKSYITAQIGGGQSSLNVNTLTSGVIYIANNTISTTTQVQIKVTTKMNFVGGVDGSPVALTYFMQR